MNRKAENLYIGFILSVIAYILHWSAGHFYFYWIYWWYDVIVHFMAGVAGGFIGYWLLFDSNLIFRKRFSNKLLVGLAVFAGVTAFGVGWEYIEYITGATDSAEGYHLDVFNDLVLDACGGLLATLICLRKENHG